MNKQFPRKEDPEFLLIESIISGDPSGSIVASEKRGQDTLVNSDVLPKKFIYCTKHDFESMGIVFGDEADDLFVFVTLPEGWSKQATNHSMWSNLVDERGRTRAQIFYKAAFYDRHAHISISRRYSFTIIPVTGWDFVSDSEWHCVVRDGEEPIWTSERIPPQPKFSDQDYIKWSDQKESLKEQALQWLNQHYPDWENPLAYWNEETPHA